MKIHCLSVLLLLTSALSAQTPVEVYNGSFKIASVSEDTLYFAFAKGDQVIFDFESIGRELKEFEILQLPHGSLFRVDDKTKIFAQKISIPVTAVYKFRLANRSATERECKLHIRRIPGSASTKNFKTTVAWKTVNDTTYTPAKEKYVTQRDTSVINRQALLTVQGTQSSYGSTTQCPEFDLPGNIIAWSFYIGVNRQAQQVYQEAEQKFSKSNAAQSMKMPGYGLLAAFALTGKSYFTPLQNEQAITYSIVDGTNATLAKQQQPFKSIRSKKVTNDFSAMKEPLVDKCYFYLSNETAANLDVMVKVAAVVVYEKWAERPIQKMRVLPRKVPVVKL
jgi:hypothetical protein